jgi:hypothetical protein
MFVPLQSRGSKTISNLDQAYARRQWIHDALAELSDQRVERSDALLRLPQEIAGKTKFSWNETPPEVLDRQLNVSLPDLINWSQITL